MTPKLNDSQLKQLAEFTSNLGLVFFAGLVIPIFSGLDKVEPFGIISGIVFNILSIVISLYLLRKIRK